MANVTHHQFPVRFHGRINTRPGPNPKLEPGDIVRIIEVDGADIMFQMIPSAIPPTIKTGLPDATTIKTRPEPQFEDRRTDWERSVLAQVLKLAAEQDMDIPDVMSVVSTAMIDARTT